MGIALAAAVLLAFARPPAAAELRVGYPSDLVSEDPAGYRDRWTEILLNNVFDGLLTRDPAMRLVPELSESWSQVGPQTYEFRLRDGVRLHDGRRLTAADVVFSFERLIEPGALDGRSSPRKALLGPLASVTAVDPLTLRFELETPWPIFPAMLPFQQVVATGADGGLVGSGPFRLVERVPGEAVVFERHAAYFGGATEIPPVGPACVERLVVDIVPGNESRVAGLMAGDFDLVVNVQPHSIPALERHPRTEVRLVDGTRSFFIALNTRTPPFDDRRVRLAVAHAIDREALIAAHLGGKAALIDGILGPRTFGKNRHLPRRGHDPGQARALLAEAGYPEGLDVALDVTRPLFPLAESIAVQLAEAGIRAETLVGTAAGIGRRWRDRGGAGIGERMWLRSWGGAALDPVGIFDATHRTGGRGNAAGYSNRRLDALLDAAASELDRTQRAGLYRQAEAVASRDLPYVYLWVPQEVYGVSKRLRGFAAAPDGRLNLQDVCLEGDG
ncbi:MAG: ABC transporter substrate-binding protein [Kiloniellales bacterium]|nr:ABC transporter substrate-binding protein [Kiloniellales bacterium]